MKDRIEIEADCSHDEQYYRVVLVSGGHKLMTRTHCTSTTHGNLVHVPGQFDSLRLMAEQIMDVLP